MWSPLGVNRVTLAASSAPVARIRIWSGRAAAPAHAAPPRFSDQLALLDDAFALLVDEAGRASIRAMRGNFLIGRLPLRVRNVDLAASARCPVWPRLRSC